MALNNGALIADRYRLIRLIATGGMGQVWEATDSRLNRRVAVKVLKSEFSSDPEFLERFRFEARAPQVKAVRSTHWFWGTVFEN